jgi:beta-glucosidase
MQWIFGPVLDLHAQPQWSRCFETFGEDPYVIGQLAKAVIDGKLVELMGMGVRVCLSVSTDPPSPHYHHATGIQGPHPDFPDLPPAAATMKHFIAYGNSRFGHDRAPVDISDRTVRQM